MRITLGVSVVVALLVATPAAGRSDLARASVGYLDNGTIRLGVDLEDGGKIVSLTPSRGARVDVIHDVQQVYRDRGYEISTHDLSKARDQ